MNHCAPACRRFIDQTLQLSNLPALSGYLFGGSSVSNILGRWDGDVVAGTLDALSKQVRPRWGSDPILGGCVQEVVVRNVVQKTGSVPGGEEALQRWGLPPACV